MAAVQLAPVALNAAEDLGSGVASGALYTAQGVTMAAQGGGRSREGNQCDELLDRLSGVIELRKNAAGTPEYRELRVDT